MDRVEQALFLGTHLIPSACGDHATGHRTHKHCVREQPAQPETATKSYREGNLLAEVGPEERARMALEQTGKEKQGPEQYLEAAGEILNRHVRPTAPVEKPCQPLWGPLPAVELNPPL